MRRPASSPTLLVLAALVAVFACQQVVALVAGAGTADALFVLSAPLWRRPWTVVTSVFAHAGPWHLLGNAVALLVVGFPVERSTTRDRYLTFFVLVGVVAGVAEIAVNRTFGGLLATLGAVPLVGGLFPSPVGPVGVLGASGAILGLLGYLLASNPVAERVVGGVDLTPRAQLLLFATVAVLLVFVTAGPNVALIAHFTGLLVGLLAGRAHLLRPSSTRG